MLILKVVNQRSHWISESLFGKYFPIVYPCHVCYTAYADERDIKEHFRYLYTFFYVVNSVLRVNIQLPIYGTCPYIIYVSNEWKFAQLELQ